MLVAVPKRSPKQVKTTGAQLEILKAAGDQCRYKNRRCIITHSYEACYGCKTNNRQTFYMDYKNPKLVEGIVKFIAATVALKIGVGALQFGFGSTIDTIGKFITGGSKAAGTISKVFLNNRTARR